MHGRIHVQVQYWELSFTCTTIGILRDHTSSEAFALPWLAVYPSRLQPCGRRSHQDRSWQHVGGCRRGGGSLCDLRDALCRFRDRLPRGADPLYVRRTGWPGGYGTPHHRVGERHCFDTHPDRHQAPAARQAAIAAAQRRCGTIHRVQCIWDLKLAGGRRDHESEGGGGEMLEPGRALPVGRRVWHVDGVERRCDGPDPPRSAPASSARAPSSRRRRS